MNFPSLSCCFIDVYAKYFDYMSSSSSWRRSVHHGYHKKTSREQSHPKTMRELRKASMKLIIIKGTTKR